LFRSLKGWYTFEMGPTGENSANRLWLQVMILVALIIDVLYAAFSWSIGQEVKARLFLGGFGVTLVVLYFLLKRGYVRQVGVLFGAGALLGMLYATYEFGGVQGSSYFGTLIALVIIAMFFRGRIAIAATSLVILFGGVLLWAQTTARYAPDPYYLATFEIWLGNSIIFIIITSLVGIASRTVRRLFNNLEQEIQVRRQAEADLQEQALFLEALHETTLAIINRLELGPLLESILNSALALTNTEHGYIDMANPAQGGMTTTVARGVFSRWTNIRKEADQGVSGYILETKQALVLADYSAWPRRIPEYSDGFYALAAVPLKAQAEVIGIIGLGYAEPGREFTPRQISALEQFAELAALAVDNARLYQSAQDELRERKRIQEALALSEENLRLALSAARMGTWNWDIQTNEIDWSDAVYTLFGINKADVELNYLSYLDYIHPDDRPDVEKKVQQSLDNPDIFYSVEHRIIWPDGSLHWMAGQGRVYADETGKPIRMAGTVIDITERKQADDALRQANQQLASNALVLERRSQLLQVAAEVSRAASAILDPDELSQQVVELVQQRFKLYYVGLFLADESGEVLHLMAATGEAGKIMLRQEHKFPVGNSSMVGWCVAHRQARIALDVGADAMRFNNPLLPDSRSELALPLVSRGQALGALTIQSEIEAAFSAEDIETFQTLVDQLANAILNARLYDQLGSELEERRRVERQVRQLNSELEERVELRTIDLKRRTFELQATNRELESFSYSVSHDLRAPLRALDGFSRILLDDFQEALPEEARPHLNRIRDAAKQMSQLIDDMLRLSRVTRVEMHHDPVDLTYIAQQTIETLQNHEPDRIVTVTIHDNLTARGDAGLLRMAIENLLNNAWKFSGKTERPEIEIGKVNLQGKETFFIRDNGVGFDMAYADKLFSAFQRLHSPRDFPGTGIGLAIVQRVIHRHGGKIWAESEPGRGATFYFTL